MVETFSKSALRKGVLSTGDVAGPMLGTTDGVNKKRGSKQERGRIPSKAIQFVRNNLIDNIT